AEPNEVIVFIVTRWNEADLAGFLLDQEREAITEGEDGEPERWHIVNFQAVRDYDDITIWPETCTVEPDLRKHGEALCPGRYPIERLRRVRKKVGEYFWSALFQQKPSPAGGGIIKREWFKYRLNIDLIPRMSRIVAGADCAFTTNAASDYNVVFPLGQDSTGRYYLFRPYHEKAEAPAAIQAMAMRTRESGATVLGVESAFGQLAIIQQLREKPEMAGRPVLAIAADKDKEARARGWSPIAEQGLITLVSDGTGWEETFLKEMESFPTGKHDDLVDGVGIAFATLQQVAPFSAAAGGEVGIDIRRHLGMLKNGGR
ncbi:MAG: phage terminase large subunit, partial [Fimbriimonadaceae bacterium]